MYRRFCAALALAAAACLPAASWAASPGSADAGPTVAVEFLQLASAGADLGLLPAAAKGTEVNMADYPDASAWPWQASLSLLLMISAMLLAAHFFWRRYRALHAEVRECRLAELGVQRSEQGYRALVEAAPFPVLIGCARTGRIRFLNERSIEYFGVSREQVLGRPLAEFCQDSVVRGQLARHLGASGKLNDVEIRLHDTQGRPFWGLVSASLVEFEGRPGVFVAVNDITERKHLEARLEHLVNTDALTTLASRRRILEILEQEHGRAARYASPLTILAVDIDHFKQINDRHGHAAGDEALRAFASVLRAGLRNHDTAGRLGGEEFMVVLPQAGAEEAHQVAERLRATVEDLAVCIDKKIIRLTVSIGIASLDTCASVEELMKAADHALYAAKDAGRNRIVLHACKPH